MKIGIVSSQSRVGKTTVMLALAHAYATTQRKKVCMFSSGSLLPIVQPLVEIRKNRDSGSVGVFTAMLRTGYIKGEEVFDYAIRTSAYDTYMFDVFDGTKTEDDCLVFLNRTMGSIAADTIFLELSGPVELKRNRILMEQCDAILYVYNHDNMSIDAMNEYNYKLTPKQKAKHIYLCNMYDPRVLAEKRLSTLTGIPQKVGTVLEYNPLMVKFFLDSEYTKFSDAVCYGHPDMPIIRTQLLKVMQLFYDDERHKRINTIENWPKNPVGVYK